MSSRISSSYSAFLLRFILARLQDPACDFHARYSRIFNRWSPEELEEILYACVRKDVLGLFEAGASPHRRNHEQDSGGQSNLRSKQRNDKGGIERAQEGQEQGTELDADLDSGVDSDFEDSLVALCEEYDSLLLSSPMSSGSSLSRGAQQPLPPLPAPSLPTPLALHALPFAYVSSTSVSRPPKAGVYVHILHPCTVSRGKPSRATSTRKTALPHLYIGQSRNLTRRIAEHRDFRFRRLVPSLHYWVLERSASDRFVVLTTSTLDALIRGKLTEDSHPDEPGSNAEEDTAMDLAVEEEAELDAEQDEGDEQQETDAALLLNILELYLTLLFRTWVKPLDWANEFLPPSPPNPSATSSTTSRGQQSKTQQQSYLGLNIANPLSQTPHRRYTYTYTYANESTPTDPASFSPEVRRGKRSRIWEMLSMEAADPLVRAHADEVLEARERKGFARPERAARAPEVSKVPEVPEVPEAPQTLELQGNTKEGAEGAQKKPQDSGVQVESGELSSPRQREKAMRRFLDINRPSFSFGVLSSGFAFGILYLLAWRRRR